MEWVLRSPQIHSTFGNLGFIRGDRYHVNENCNAALETILHNILTEDKYLRTYRRSINFGQNIQKDLLPLLIHAKEEVTIDLLIRILVNLTIPIECLLSLDAISRNDIGRHTILEINNLLASTKSAFTEQRATKVIIDFLKKNVDLEQKVKLSSEQCTNITNSLLLLRNILHIPEEKSSGSAHAVQNQILWNIFSQSIDKLLIKLMIIPDAHKWAVIMVQLIALLYKDQHVLTLHKLLNLWLQASLSESSEDNESNTSSPNRGSEDFSPVSTSYPTSDSSDTGASGKINDEQNSATKNWDASQNKNNANESSDKQTEKSDSKKFTREKNTCTQHENKIIPKPICSSGVQSDTRSDQVLQSSKKYNKHAISENSDYGYDTQIENQESISTSSNEDELPTQKLVHQKPHNPKQRANKVRTGNTLQDRKRKKIVKRGKAHIINVQGLSHKTPTDEDISSILKEFTVDFLLKGYNALVQTLHNQILTNLQLEIDTSHFFWLVTYFLKFATQIELDVEHISSVLSFDIVSYLTAEGVNLCEQFELAIKLDGNDLKPNIRRLHLVITAIREIIQAIEAYKKIPHVCKDDQEALIKIQIEMCDTQELRSLLVLLLRHYNPKYHSKQYLQDLVVTNHILLMFLDTVVKLPQYTGTTNILDHVRQFATSGIMYQYGLLLEDYVSNGEFVNDCIFTLMHHVGGELESLITLFQPKILKTFTSIWKAEFEICDDWSDLIEYVINTFVKKPHSLHSSENFRLDTESFDDDDGVVNIFLQKSERKPNADVTGSDVNHKLKPSNFSDTCKEKWTEDELSYLSWNYMQCSSQSDYVAEIIKLFKEDGIIKSRNSVIQELFKQNTINKEEYEKLVKGELASASIKKKLRDDEIGKLCEQLIQDEKLQFLEWVQGVLLDTCYVKICLEKRFTQNETEDTSYISKSNWVKPSKCKENYIFSPVSYHSLVFNQSVPLVPWNCKQAATCKDLKFLQLLHKLGFHMPVDSGKVFIRIPNFWTADFLYYVAGKILPIDKSKLKFSINDISDSSVTNSKRQECLILSTELTKDITLTEPSENFYQIHKQRHLATMMNYTPMPGSSFGSENVNIDKNNWLEFVKRSHEYKIGLNIGSNIIEDENSSKMQPPSVVKEISPPSPLLATFPSEASTSMAPFPQPIINLPTIMSIKQDASDFNVADAEICSNSLCETASVASDLTRMYVSDEDEKPEIMTRPIIKMNIPPDCPITLDDSDNDNGGKRARVQFYPQFT